MQADREAIQRVLNGMDEVGGQRQNKARPRQHGSSRPETISRAPVVGQHQCSVDDRLRTGGPAVIVDGAAFAHPPLPADQLHPMRSVKQHFSLVFSLFGADFGQPGCRIRIVDELTKSCGPRGRRCRWLGIP